jgi:hypothetical protein
METILRGAKRKRERERESRGLVSLSASQCPEQSVDIYLNNDKMVSAVMRAEVW